MRIAFVSFCDNQTRFFQTGPAKEEHTTVLPDDIWQKYTKVKAWCDAISQRPHSQTVNTLIMEVGQTRRYGPAQKTDRAGADAQWVQAPMRPNLKLSA